MFYVPNLLPSAETILLTEEESSHCIRVLRKQPGDEIQVLDGKGGLYTAAILDAHPKKCTAKVLNYCFEKPTVSVHLAVAPTKNMDRIEWLVEKGTELGCTQFTFILTKRSERTKVNMERIHKIAVSAMKQSKRVYLPILDTPMPLNEFLTKHPGGWVAHCDDALPRDQVDASGPFRILIGPEGDFTPDEVNATLKATYRPVTLGDARLRTETAALKSIIILEGLAARG
jgi:16S rRNA (uracil1498-N3)-methyltransferase